LVEDSVEKGLTEKPNFGGAKKVSKFEELKTLKETLIRGF
jgi:hypothetical protein